MQFRATTNDLARIAHAASLYLLGLASVAMLGWTLLAAAGLLPWIALQAGIGGALLPQAGPVAQIGLTALLLLLLAFFPGSARVMALEKGHRDFRVNMQDVANAYHVAHMADRRGAFTLSSEFDAVRERIEYLRDHPDLKLLEADILTVAAQMSQQSHRLASVYSDDKVARARDFLAQRQKEVEDQQRRIQEALQVSREIMRWNSQVELEEAMVASQVQQLEEQLGGILPDLGYRLERDEARRAANVFPMGMKPAAE